MLTGADALRSMAHSFGLDSTPSVIPLQVAESTVGIFADAAALGMSSIGQKDVALTPLENAEIAATIANGGVTMQPYLIDSLKGPDLANISTTAPYQQRRAVSPQVAAKLTELMVGAEKDAQQKGAIPGVQIASKTGTAEHGSDPRNTPPHAWYIAFAPAQDAEGRRGGASGERRRPPFGDGRGARRADRTGRHRGRTTGGPMSPRVGVTLSGRYRLQRLIATGGMGQVWEAVDSRLGRRVAVKVLKAEFSQDSEFIERFRAEARTTAMLNHPGIAAVHDYGESQMDGEGRTAYLVMEFVNGEPLNSVLKRTGRLSLRHALDLLEQTGRALQIAHAAGLVHRDVKPGNILITPTGQVKITDFGIAKAVDAAPVTQTGMVMGTAQYIAPEQALGHDATPSSDVYSLGVVGYEVVSGKRPFTGDGALTVAMKHIKEPPPPLPPELPPNVRELIEITLVKNPGMRYRSGGPFADAVAAVRAGRRPPRPSQSPPPGRASPAAIPSSPQTRATPGPRARSAAPRRSRPSTGSRRQPPARRTFSSGQRALLWAAGVLGALAIIIAVLIVINSRGTTSTSLRPRRSPTPARRRRAARRRQARPPAVRVPALRLDWTDRRDDR